jgi:hypothetical protein
MRLLNTKEPEISLALVPWFIPDNQDPLDMGWELHERLRTKPDETFCLIAIENNIIQAILIAYTRKRDVWIWQVHARNKFKYGMLMFDGLYRWAIRKKKKKIRGATYNERYNKLFERKYGFTLQNGELIRDVKFRSNNYKKDIAIQPLYG